MRNGMVCGSRRALLARRYAVSDLAHAQAQNGLEARAPRVRVRRASARPPRDRTVAPYAGEPADLSPYAKFAKPYDLNYIHPEYLHWRRPRHSRPKNLTEVRIGFFGPIDTRPDQVFGLRMLHGAQLAIDEANARGGYGGKPFRLMLHNDYDNWQAKAVYGDDRPTDPAIWGSAVERSRQDDLRR